MRSRAIPAILLLVCMLGATSCGGRPNRVPVSGRVLIDGQPLTVGYIAFANPDHRPAGSRIDKDGHFSLMCYEPNDGAVLGHHKVQVSGGEQLKDQISTRWHAPKKYANFNTSGLEQEITGPIDNLEINLTWKGNKESNKVYVETPGGARGDAGLEGDPRASAKRKKDNPPADAK